VAGGEDQIDVIVTEVEFPLTHRPVGPIESVSPGPFGDVLDRVGEVLPAPALGDRDSRTAGFRDEKSVVGVGSPLLEQRFGPLPGLPRRSFVVLEDAVSQEVVLPEHPPFVQVRYPSRVLVEFGFVVALQEFEHRVGVEFRAVVVCDRNVELERVPFVVRTVNTGQYLQFVGDPVTEQAEFRRGEYVRVDQIPVFEYAETRNPVGYHVELRENLDE